MAAAHRTPEAGPEWRQHSREPRVRAGGLDAEQLARAVRVAAQGQDRVPLLLERPNEPRADQAGGPGDGDLHRPGTTPNSSVWAKPTSAPATAVPDSRASSATAAATAETTSRL